MIESMYELFLQLIGWIVKGICQLIIYLISKMFSSWIGFIIGIIVIGAIFLTYKCTSSSSADVDKSQTELYQSKHSTYICTANKSLKVRTAPDANAQQIGSLMAGEEVEVYEIVGDFARIQFNGSEGYASTKYLKQK